MLGLVGDLVEHGAVDVDTSKTEHVAESNHGTDDEEAGRRNTKPRRPLDMNVRHPVSHGNKCNHESYSRDEPKESQNSFALDLRLLSLARLELQLVHLSSLLNEVTGRYYNYKGTIQRFCLHKTILL